MNKSRRMAWALTVAFAVLIPMTAQAADKDVKIAIVDFMKVAKDAPRVKQHYEELAKFEGLLKAKIDVRSQNMMLTEDEIKELVELKTKTTPTDADKARAKVLEDTEKGRDAELKKLQETKEPTDQDKARLKELQDMQQKSKDTGSAIFKDYQGQFQAKGQEIDGKITADVTDAVKKVAEAKGFTHVLDKVVVLFGGTDITEDVIAKLDRKMQ